MGPQCFDGTLLRLGIKDNEYAGSMIHIKCLTDASPEPEDNESDGESAWNKKKAPAKFKPDFTDDGEIKIPASGTAGVDGVRQKGAFVRGVFAHYYSMSPMLEILLCHS